VKTILEGVVVEEDAADSHEELRYEVPTGRVQLNVRKD
jgi:hypothetical protein